MNIGVNGVCPACLQRIPGCLDEIRLKDIVVEQKRDGLPACAHYAIIGAHGGQSAVAVVPHIDDPVVAKRGVADREFRSVRGAVIDDDVLEILEGLRRRGIEAFRK